MLDRNPPLFPPDFEPPELELGLGDLLTLWLGHLLTLELGDLLTLPPPLDPPLLYPHLEPPLLYPHLPPQPLLPPHLAIVCIHTNIKISLELIYCKSPLDFLCYNITQLLRQATVFLSYLLTQQLNTTLFYQP